MLIISLWRLVLIASVFIETFYKFQPENNIFQISEFTDLAFPLIYSSMLVSEVVFQGWMCNEITEQVLIIGGNYYLIQFGFYYRVYKWRKQYTTRFGTKRANNTTFCSS